MSTKSSDSKKSVSVVTSKPLMPSVIALSTEVAERGITTSFDLLIEARSELKSVTDATLSYADNLAKTTIGFMRTVATGIDQLALASLEQGKATALDFVSVARNTSVRATGLAANAASDIVGDQAA